MERLDFDTESSQREPNHTYAYTPLSLNYNLKLSDTV